MSYIDIIKAKRAEQDARELATRLESERQYKACVDGFKEIRDAWNEVRCLLVPHCGCTGRGEKYDNCTMLVFWNSSGNYGPRFRCTWDEEAGEVKYLYNERKVSRRELLDQFLNFLATRIPAGEVRRG